MNHPPVCPNLFWSKTILKSFGKIFSWIISDSDAMSTVLVQGDFESKSIQTFSRDLWWDLPILCSFFGWDLFKQILPRSSWPNLKPPNLTCLFFIYDKLNLSTTNYVSIFQRWIFMPEMAFLRQHSMTVPLGVSEFLMQFLGGTKPKEPASKPFLILGTYELGAWDPKEKYKTIWDLRIF